ncbi:hypothetical protein HNQ02_003455 [Flavobacterium sp. 7E]|uniref:hypothetical protein n=1 Tax=unclassified Flavobacterium TaxID=196869 RepID=UPI00156E18C7|nr:MULTISPECIES: hypothetical protein [unclassified Flavobacterium]NRS90511.1 hypothetical protein [Flavobacterium sp. 7E]NRT16259.1 hypothetical protein [Flavobacterium sp. 28A]
MKKILKFSLVLVALLAALNVSALENEFSLDVKKGQGKTVNFALYEANKVVLSIYDLDHKLIHKENVISTGSINRTYDLKALPEGTYFLFAESDAKIAKYEISVVGETAVLAAKPVTEVYKPVLINKEGVVCFSISNASKAPVSVEIYNESEDLVYSSSFVDKQNIQQYYDIKSLPFENYTFIMSYDNDKVFEKTVSAK